MRRPLCWMLALTLSGLFLLTGSTPPAQAQGCGDAPVPRLTLGGQGQVAFSDGQPLNIRETASVDGGRIGSLPEGSAFAVLEGPVCADGIYWWRIQAADLTGWAAEGQAGAYFAEPLADPGVAGPGVAGPGAAIQPVTEDPPLLMSAYTGEGFNHPELYRATGDGWEALTSGGYKRGFALSPLGDRVVYQTAPPIMQDAIERGLGHLFGVAWDVAVLDLETGATRSLTTQPETIRLTADDLLRDAVDRALPVWSPDGSAIAWVEQDYPARDAARLVIYDFTTESLRVLDEALPFMTMSADGFPAFFAWGGPGIAVFTNDPADNAETIRLYDPAAGLQKAIRAVDETLGAWRPLASPLWVNAGERDTLVIQAGQFAWLGVDPVEGRLYGWNNPLLGTSATGGTLGLQVIWEIFAFGDQAAWQVLYPAEGVLMGSLIAPTPAQFAIAPSGLAVALWLEDTLTVWQADAPVVLDVPEDLRPQALLWGAVRWSAGEAYGALG